MTEATLLTDALVTGRLDALPEETLFLFARCGLLYVFTAAGLHLAAAARLGDALSWPLRRLLPEGRARDAAALAARCALMLWFGLGCGWEAPMARALTYQSLRSAARFLEIDADKRWLFVLSLLAGAVLGRGTLFAFLLGASALAGALFLEPRGRGLRSFGPWLCTLPLVAWHYGLVCLLGPLWSLTAGSALGLGVLPLALAARLGATLGLPAGRLEELARDGTALVTEALRGAEGVTGGAVWVRALPWALLSLGLLAALALRRRRPRGALAAAAAGLLAAAWPLPALSVLDVGQGDGIFMRPASGNLVLMDVGPPGFRGREASAALGLEALGVGALGDVALSHFDLDHRGGLDSVLARHPVRGALWFREEDLSAKNFEKVLLAAERAGVPVRFLTDEAAPAGLRCWLAPYREGNDSCPLCRATLPGGASVLLTGDMSEETESWYVMALAPFPRADFLKVAHHGSRTSSSAPFLAASGARTALVSVGARNRYGHPTAEALSRLAQAGMRVRRTDLEGSLSYYPYFSDLIEESMRPVASAGSRVYPGRPATAR